jgi:hypothetical protein
MSTVALVLAVAAMTYAAIVIVGLGLVIQSYINGDDE